MESKNKRGINVYKIPIGKRLYRGDTPAYKYFLEDGHSFRFNPGFYFFGTNIRDVEQYGIVFEFVTTRPYQLIALDNNESLQQFKRVIGNPDIENIIDRNYGAINGIRDSISEKDKALSEYLCQNDYDGYAILKDRTTPTDDIFHKELMICDTTGIRFTRIVTEQSKLQNLLDEYEIRSVKPPSKSRKSVALEYSPPRGSLFDSPPRVSLFDSPQSGFKRDSQLDRPHSGFKRGALFGGNKNKSNKNRKLKRNKTKKRKDRK